MPSAAASTLKCIKQNKAKPFFFHFLLEIIKASALDSLSFVNISITSLKSDLTEWMNNNLDRGQEEIYII